MEPASWSVVTQAAEWLRRALGAARNKQQQRFARLIEHAGTVVAGLRALDREAHRLFLPLIYGDIRTWPDDQRAKLSEDLVAFAHESHITSALNISLATLEDLSSQQADRDTGRLIAELTALVARRGVSKSASMLLIDANVASLYDFEVGTELDGILQALDDPAAADPEYVRWVARQFVYGNVSSFTTFNVARDSFSNYNLRNYSEHPWLHIGDYDRDEVELALGPAHAAVTTLRPFAEMAEGIFGQLLALQHRIFPDLPTPIWVWRAD